MWSGFGAQLFLAICAGWWFKERCLNVAPQLGDQVNELRSLMEEFAEDLSSNVDDHAKRVGELSQELDTVQSAGGAESRDAERNIIAQILEANKQLHEKLAASERRIQQQVLQIQSMSTGGRGESAAAEGHAKPADDPQAKRQHEAGADSTGSAADAPASKPGPGEVLTKRELRLYARKPFLRSAMIAPYVATRFPTPEEFLPIQCFDISLSGISFFLPEPPTHKRYVIALGQGNDVIYTSAEVVRRQVTKLHTLAMYFIGCRLTGRLQPPGPQPAPTAAAQPASTRPNLAARDQSPVGASTR